MTTAGVVFLGIIAVATLGWALVQVGVLLFAMRMERRIQGLSAQLEHDIKPLLANLTEVSQKAVRASSLAVQQVERADRLFADTATRVDETITLVQAAIVAPAREGRALMTAVRAATKAFRELRAARVRARMEEEDALFIG